ncbi:PAS domain S-box protein [Fodinibius sp. Rm-B-1B1-1]|uniref:PAS domain S-box protein n=1 Tax=Fodinibius alkaliphilus TaxID=3140241 RepID=UPI00315ACB97
MDWKDDLSSQLAPFWTDKSVALNKIIDSFPEIIILANPDLTILAVNNTVDPMLGFEPSELTGQKVTSIYADTDDLEKLKQTGFFGDPDVQNITFEAGYKKKSGGVWEGETVLKKVNDDNGDLIGYLGVLRDISVRKRHEREIEKFFSLPLNLMCTATPDGYFNEINDQFSKVLGYSKEELISRPFVELIHPNDVEPTMEEIGKLEAGERDVTVNFENRFRRKDGSYCWLAWTSTFDEESGLLYAIAQNVTDRKELERNLIEAREKAEEANRAKSQFVANMSHEIRTPMNSILGFADMMKELVDSDLEKEYIENIRKSGKNLLKLINDVLDLSKIEAGKKQVNIRPVDVARVVDEMKSMFALQAGDKGVEIRTNIADDLPASLLIDEMKLRQILLNLVGNAVKFTEKGYVEIGVRVKKFDEIESMVTLEIYVKDTGMGITKGKQETIFHEFEQEDETIADKFGGTGLGLSISNRLARLMDGTVKVESERGKGSTFILTIPELSISSVVEESREIPDASYEMTLKEGRIMVVDDIELNRQLIVEFLRDYPIEVLEAVNGIEAVDIASEKELDLIFMDIKMVQMDGVEAMRRIKEQGKEVPIVALTASAFDVHSSRDGKRWFDGYLRKPVNRSQILQQLVRYIGLSEESDGEASAGVDGKQPEEAAGPSVSKQEKKELVEQLENEVSSFVEELDTDSIVMDQYKELLSRAKTIEENIPEQRLAEFNKKLKSAIQLFDIEQIRSLATKDYPELLDELKK